MLLGIRAECSMRLFFHARLATCRETDLFAKMARAASMTQASMEQEDNEKDHLAAKPPRNRHGTGPGDGGGIEFPKETAIGNMGNSSRSLKVSGLQGNHSIEDDRHAADAASEFECVTQTLKRSGRPAAGGRGQDGVSVGMEVMVGGEMREHQLSSSAQTMDVDSEEEETVTLAGEFQSAAVPPVAKPAGGRVSGKSVPVVAVVADAVDDRDDDLMSAVKKGKGKKGKGWANGGKKKA